MKRLFIIGNGFDLSHKLRTSYNDFRNYLKEECNGNFQHKIEISTDIYGNDTVSRESVSRFILNLFDGFYDGKKWGDIENELVNINIYNFLKNSIFMRII